MKRRGRRRKQRWTSSPNHPRSERCLTSGAIFPPWRADRDLLEQMRSKNISVAWNIQTADDVQINSIQSSIQSCRANLCHLNLLYGNCLTETLLTASGNSELVVKSKKIDFTKPIEQIRCVFCRSGIFHKSTRYQVSTYEDSFREDWLILKIQYCCCSCCRCSRNFQF